MTQHHNTFLFEVSWEVCNKVGGIYTVLQSKARFASQEFGENYYLLGPDLKTNREFEETDEECWQRIREGTALKDLPCRFGRWTTPGRPKVILVSFAHKYNRDQLLYQLWEWFGVDSIAGGWDYVEPVMFSYACSEVIETLFNLAVRPMAGSAIAQFHEWMCGAGLLGIKKRVPEIGTVFTTHATILGRAIAGSGRDIYAEMEQIAPQKEAVAHNITAKFSMEAASAREADCFTTVSAITAVEARNFLGRKPEVILPNGLDIEHIPDLTVDRAPAAEARQKLADFATRMLGQPIPQDSRFLLISGRYEYHNKGVDVFVEALARLQQDIPADRYVVAFFFVMGGYSEINPSLREGGSRLGQPPLLATHRLHNEASDPILEACARLDLRNAPESRVKVIFMPAFLDGFDGLLNMKYYEVLSACDLGVFPSFYEPWGYTPLESAAFAVPTITTDQAGFGIWVRDNQHANHGVIVQHRHGKSLQTIANDLHAALKEFLGWSESERQQRRRAARDIASHANWADFFQFYLRAFEAAEAHARWRVAQESSAQLQTDVKYTFTGTASTQPHFRLFSAVVNLPEEIKRLREIAYNLWWAWNPEALELFALLDPHLWSQIANNPVAMLESVSPERLLETARNEEYLELYRRVVQHFDDYMAERRGDKRQLRSPAIKSAAPVAYFSAEYGLHESLPIYSGGLGVLSGDHLKAASDLNIPLVGIGLLYKSGYFRQRIDKNGWQVAEFPVNDFSSRPARVLQDDRANEVQIALALPGRTLHAVVWQINVGRVTLYLLDTDIPHNTAQDRGITARLYCADRRTRIEQEILVGMGGVRLLRRLGINPSVFHMNEGHSAFLTLERINLLMTEDGLSFDEAREVVRGNTAFTTHTPVEAGNERFDRDIIEFYFAGYIQRLGLTWPQFWELGRRESGDDKPFFMTILGLKLASQRNGVSRLHGEVARHMWRDVWQGFHPSDVPIRHITNGVHVPSHVAAPMARLYDTYVGLNWQKNLHDPVLWKRVQEIPNALLWQAKSAMKQNLTDSIRTNCAQHWQKFGDARSWREEVLGRINPGALFVCFARRFAPYKRAHLLFTDLDRLNRIVNDEKRPVHFVFAGKAHPNDGLGIELMKKVIDASNDPRFRGRIFFLEDYDLRIARCMFQGADVWLNTPIRPYEASGTSGQKAAANGTLNLSIADGWWCEGYDGQNGWTIGPALTRMPADNEQPDEADSKALYALLEESVVPIFYERDGSGLSAKWLAMMKHSIETLVPQFNTDRMLRQYFTEMYAPAAERGAALSAGNYSLARTITDWKRKVPMRFSSLRIIDVSVEGIHGDTIPVGKPFAVKVRIDPGKTDPAELLVELVLGKSDGVDFMGPPQCLRLQPAEKQKDHLLLFAIEHTVSENGRYSYGIRVMPHHPDLASTQDAELILWG